MNAEEAARATAEAVVLPACRFHAGRRHLQAGGELGFDGVDFYTAGRGGALGDVDGMVVAAAFVFFNPETVVAGVGAHPVGDVAPRVGAGLRRLSAVLGPEPPARRGGLPAPGRAARAGQRRRVTLGRPAVRGVEGDARAR